MRYEIRELNVGGILDQAIKLVKENFWLLLKIAAIIYIPYGLIAGLLLQAYTPDMTQMQQAGSVAAQSNPFSAIGAPFWIVLAVTMVVGSLIITPLTDAAVIYAVGNSYLGKPIGVGSAFQRAFRIFVPLLITWILWYLAITAPMVVAALVALIAGPIGLILVPIMGILSVVFVFWFLLAAQVVVIEGVFGTTALSRSKKLMKGNLGTAFVLAILVGIIVWIINMGSQLIPQPQIAVVVATILQSIIFIFSYASWVVFYFSCRCKHENFDLTMLADSVAMEEPSVVRP